MIAKGGNGRESDSDGQDRGPPKPSNKTSSLPLVPLQFALYLLSLLLKFSGGRRKWLLLLAPCPQSALWVLLLVFMPTRPLLKSSPSSLHLLPYLLVHQAAEGRTC
ncbi:hypothetical protein OPV22_000241 [Ensete ventricosum]|uniref:Uncharacterized protein n=1 Tax=Ensete ventricosum TaxID=4639 RepID=A0AAV8RSP3_ENSVE|nr:hypothetical protein OPV22_000241 [Ensete ventricosum]